MKLLKTSTTIAISTMLLCIAAPVTALAHDEVSPHMTYQSNQEDHVRWAQMHLDHEAAMLEIKASQESAWEAYSAASLELMNTYVSRKVLPPDITAAAAMRQHADQAFVFAQSLSKLADATEKLQALLNEDQRKILDRIVRLHSQAQGHHSPEGWFHSDSKNETPSSVGIAKPKPSVKQKN